MGKGVVGMGRGRKRVLPGEIVRASLSQGSGVGGRRAVAEAPASSSVLSMVLPAAASARASAARPRRDVLGG